jgi:hypothetical protein
MWRIVAAMNSGMVIIALETLLFQVITARHDKQSANQGNAYGQNGGSVALRNDQSVSRYLVEAAKYL